MKNRYLIVLLTLVASSAFGQITVTSSDIEALRGTTSTMYSRSSTDLTGLSTVIAATGSGRTWSITNRTYSFSDSTSTSYLSYPGTAPQASDPAFTSSNLVLRSISTTAQGTTTNWSFYKLDPAAWLLYGIVNDAGGTQTKIAYSAPIKPLAFPVALNSTWTSTANLTTSGITTTLTYEYLVDGEGTITTPEGSFSCLRLRLKLSSSTTVFGFTTTVISYVYSFTDKTRSYAAIAADANNAPISVSYSSTTSGQVSAPSAPTLASPADGATGVAVTPTLSWNSVSGATTYNLQVSTSSTFAATVVNQTGITTTSLALTTALSNNTQYFWRVSATNSAGTSANSTARSFTTIVALPAVPSLSSPADGATGVSTTPALSWAAVSGATSYTVQVSTSSSFATTVVNQSNVTGTSYQVTPALSVNTQYFWRVSATNAAGTSANSAARSFTTATPSSVEQISAIPSSFELGQNYPNPFNPSTTIGFRVSGSGFVSLKVLDVLGREVATLVNQELNPGTYKTTWEATSMPSGTYLYQLQSNGLLQTKSMILLK